ncbi:hypothetical protein LTR32_004964 [Rachicladosporium monterosium]|uniref:Ca3427-like PBP 2 domain-containing protein n=1 Tax=Rachicladosporium monterosium TaxID=1507873 RepID=A0ABR0L341_9PEZI|nr:hypothetical protein LTR32_004964 [Rachicladosporium monterosium]
MGGSAFAAASAHGEPTLNTPRLTQEDYTRLKAILKTSLQAFFGPNTKLDTLSEAPEKDNFGDIDFIVARDEPTDWLALATSIGAAGLIAHHPSMRSLAVPIADTGSTRPPVSYKPIPPQKLKTSPMPAMTVEQYAQIDIETVSTALYPWRTFYSSYGDLSSILGHILRPLGFKLSENGLFLRLKELEQAKSMLCHGIADHDGLLFLSRSPGKVMQFLGLSADRYEQGFATLDELYVWLGHCRGVCAELGWTRKQENSSDRAKEKRTVFMRFLEEWVPAHYPSSLLDANTDSDAAKKAREDKVHKKRQETLEEALTLFKKQADYDVMHESLIRAISNSSAASLLRPIISLHSGRADKQLTEIVRAFRRFTGVHTGESGRLQLRVLETPHTDAECELWRLVDVVDASGERELRDWATTPASDPQAIDVAIGLTEGFVADLGRSKTAGKEAGFGLVGTYVESPLCWAISTGAERGDGGGVGDLRGKRVGVSRIGSGSYVMAFVLADQQGWLKDGEEPFGVEVIGDFAALRKAVREGEGGKAGADFFMWEHFTTKHYWDCGELKRVGEIYTPWPSWMVAARDPEDARLEGMAEKINQGVKYYLEHKQEAVQHITSTMKYSKEDAEAWMGTVKFAEDVRGVDTGVVDETVKVLRKAGVLTEEAGGSEHMVAMKRS